MVTINATIVVLLVMFLGFLWIMHRTIFAPLLAHMDQRSGQIAEDRRMAAEAGSEAEVLEDRYAAEIARIHREANRRLVQAHREAQEAHLERITQYRGEAEAEVRALSQSLAKDIADQEGQFPDLAVQIRRAMAAKLELE